MEIQTKLFEISPVKPVVRKECCKNCMFFDWIEYDSGRKIFYCKIRKSGRTENGLIKIKASQVACDGFKKN